jgi:hypothetical protein
MRPSGTCLPACATDVPLRMPAARCSRHSCGKVQPAQLRLGAAGTAAAWCSWQVQLWHVHKWFPVRGRVGSVKGHVTASGPEECGRYVARRRCVAAAHVARCLRYPLALGTGSPVAVVRQLHREGWIVARRYQAGHAMSAGMMGMGCRR